MNTIFQHLCKLGRSIHLGRQEEIYKLTPHHTPPPPTTQISNPTYIDRILATINQASLGLVTYLQVRQVLPPPFFWHK